MNIFVFRGLSVLLLRSSASPCLDRFLSLFMSVLISVPPQMAQADGRQHAALEPPEVCEKKFCLVTAQQITSDETGWPNHFVKLNCVFSH